MDDDADDPYRLPSEEELAHLGEYWWHSWLIDPIMRGDLPAIQRYLARKPDGLHTECPSYFDPFIVAAQQPTPGALRLLLEHWAVHPTPDAPLPNERGSPLFHVACAHGALETVRYLLDEQPALASVHARSSTNRHTPILEAAAFLVFCAEKEQAEVMDEAAGRARFNAPAARERVHLSEALMGLLLDRGACASDSVGYKEWDTGGPSVVDSIAKRETVLSLAIARAGPALLRRLIDEGADALATTSDWSHHIRGSLFDNSGISRNLTLLHLAAFYGNYSGIQVLMEHYAQRGLEMTDAVACRDQFGRLPIHYAAAGWPGAWLGLDPDSTDIHAGIDTADIHTDTTALLRLLTESGNPRFTNAPDEYSETPLHYALSPNLITHRAAIAVARFLCTDLAAVVNAVDEAGNTPLHLAARCLAHVPAAEFLLDRGADVRIRNKRGRTPLHEAAAGVGHLGWATVSGVEENIGAQDAMLAVLCGRAGKVLVLEKNWDALMDEGDVEGKTPRQIAEETRAAWRE
ncbi:hypothetical protein N0V82_007754, partial [Gnomoniopsis sp. IMI 355080]